MVNTSSLHQSGDTQSGLPRTAPEVAGQRPIGRIFACVLTYNRKETALTCLQALLEQTRPVDEIVVFDNGSTDGTKEFLEHKGFIARANFTFLRVEKNRGPAAGFAALFEYAYSGGCGWVWVMDDDVIPEPNALEELVSAYSANFSTPETVGFLTSLVRSPDGQPNNVPDADNRQDGFAPPRWAEFLGQGMARIKFSTFCSILIPRSTIERFGFPSADFFYGGEDIDYTLRVTREVPGYLVGRSVVTHLRVVSGKFHILAETDPSRIPLYYYYYRNQLYLRRAFLGRYALARFIGSGLYDMLRAVRRGRIGRKMSATMLRGLVAGFFFHPSNVQGSR
jgi:GT2 family glycosyltransferase